MRSIAVINQKGGVGKTTSAVNLAAALAAAGRRVQLLDVDPQAHASLHLGSPPTDSAPNMYDVLVGGASLAAARRGSDDGVDLVPSHLDLAAAEVELAGVVGREMILRDKLEEVQAAHDYLLIDCPPSLGVLTLNALAAVEEVFLPLQPHFLALHGLSKLLASIELVRKRLNPRLRLSGVMFCMCDSAARLTGEVIDDVEEFFAAGRQVGGPWAGVRTFESRIRRNIRLAEAPSHGQSIFRYAPDSNGAEDYASLACEVIAQETAGSRPAAEHAA